jgi:hypothetical protein
MNDWIWKGFQESRCSLIKVLHLSSLEDRRKEGKTSVIIASATVEIRTNHLSNTSVESYRYTNVIVKIDWWRSCLRHYATSRKIAGSNPYEVDIFNLPNPSSRTVALGWTQPLTEMSSRNVSGVKGGRRVGLTTSPPSVSRLSRQNLEASTSHNTMGLHGLLQGSLTVESTNQLHGGEPFLKSRQLWTYSRTSQHFKEPESSSLCSQEPSTGPYPGPDQCSRHYPTSVRSILITWRIWPFLGNGSVNIFPTLRSTIEGHPLLGNEQ